MVKRFINNELVELTNKENRALNNKRAEYLAKSRKAQDLKRLKDIRKRDT